MKLARWFRPSLASRPAPARQRTRLSVECLEARDNPSGGLLDPTFGSGGIAPYNFVSGYNQGLADVKVLPDGKLLAAGTANGDFAAARYNPDGTPDTSFGTGGVTTIDFSRGSDRAMAVSAVQAGTGGKVLVAGTAQTSKGQLVFGVVRLNPNGTLDTTFGDKTSKGKVTAAPDSRSSSQVYSMAVLPDGKFVLAGLTLNVGSTGRGSVSLARFNADGTLDTTFGSKGTVLTTITAAGGSNVLDHSINLAVDAAGRLIVSGTAPQPRAGDSADFLVARFNPNGSLDTTFGAAGTGVVTTDLGTGAGNSDQARSMSLDANGRIVVAGETWADDGFGARAAVVRYNPNGSLDPTFDDDGIATVMGAGPGGAYWDTMPKAMAVQPDGRILLAGHAWPTTSGDSAPLLLMRFNGDGSLDTSYGPSGTGTATTMVTTSFPRVSAMALQPDGRVVVAGQVVINPAPYQYSFALYQFTASTVDPSPVQVGSFAAPDTASAGATATLTAGNITDANSGATIAKVAFYALDASGVEQFLGYGTQQPDGYWKLTFTVNLAPGGYTLLALAADSTGAVSDPISLGLTVA